MINDVMVFTPVYRLEPETVEAVLALEWDGPITHVFQRDNPLKGSDRQTGVRNHLHQYQRGRELFLQGRYDAMLVIESDIIPPPDTLKRLAALDADAAYGAYMFRQSRVVNICERYYSEPEYKGKKVALEVGESLTTRGKWPWAEQQGQIVCSGGGLGCVLIKRHVLEAIDFRTTSTAIVHCDTWFTNDVYDGGFNMMADAQVHCGHKRENGEILMPPPFLSIVTRCHPQRASMLAKNIDSLKAQTDQGYQHILLEDDEGRGLEYANSMLQWADPEGEYVLILDDDDMLIDDEAIAKLRDVVYDRPDVVMFRAEHAWLGTLPSARVWQREPIQGHIGSCDFIVRRDVWLEHIKAFAQPRCGDYHFIRSVWDSDPDVEWLPDVLAGVQRISGGAPE